jgi:pimeloyl-ACP methyl ester carboxylesterase
MPQNRRLALVCSLILAILGVALAPARSDSVILKNGTVLKGTVDHDNTIYFVFDGLKRVVLRESKIARIEANAGFRNVEVFKLEQPLVVHAGAMPKEVLKVEAKPWNDRGRREFLFWPNPNKSVGMEQAINELGPYVVKIRGVDGFWQGQLALSQIPREVVLGLLAKIDRTNRDERRRAYTFLVQAEWYAESKAALDHLVRDFPELRDQVANARAAVVQLEASQLKAEIDVRRGARQPREVLRRLKTFPNQDVSSELLIEVRDQLRRDEAQAAADVALADSLRKLADRLPSTTRKKWKQPLLEMLKALNEAPDAVRDRFDAWRKAEADGGKNDDEQFALALSGFVIGADAAVTDLATALSCWNARDLVHDYLAGGDDATRAEALAKLQAVNLSADPAPAAGMKKLDVITRLVQRMAPPLHRDGGKTGETLLHRVSDDPSEVPSEYAVVLPPEYHPLRSYPAVVALHSGGGPASAVSWWATEAARRGYIVIAPEYNVPGQDHSYHYTTSEHAAAELSLRDARRRYAIDSDRVFVGGQLVGGDMAWDFGLAHPDLFAGVVVISGDPGKYVTRTLPRHTERLPLYVALGDLAPASNEIVFATMIRPLIAKGYDVTYVEYVRRGREDFPEEAPAVFDWMDRRRREPFPKTFEAVTARDCDTRFYGVVVREFAAGRTTAPEAADPDGKNLAPATIKVKSSSLSNLLNLQLNGVKSLDVWVSSKLIDFQRRLEVRINGKPYFKGMAKPDLEPLLEDLRLRGDRQQVYWLKVPAG